MKDQTKCQPSPVLCFFGRFELLGVILWGSFLDRLLEGQWSSLLKNTSIRSNRDIPIPTLNLSFSATWPLPSVGKLTVALHWLVDSNRLKFFEFLWSGFLHQSCWGSFMMDFRIAFLGEFSKDEAQIRGRYGGIPNRSDAGVFKVRITLVWRQFPLEQDEVTGRLLGVAALSIFLTLTLAVEKRSRKMTPKTARNDQKNTKMDSVDTLFDLSLNYLLSNFIAVQIATNVSILIQIDNNNNNNTDRGWLACDRS